jgi:fructose/tagatose bisphosphate aldolase
VSGAELREADLQAALDVDERGRPVVVDDKRLREAVIGPLVQVATFGDEPRKATAQAAIRAIAHEVDVVETSIQPLYGARGRGEVGGFTVPAMNLRTMTYDMARAAFRAARREDVGAFVFELARSEMGYTDQSPAEYASAVLGAAIREGHEGPVFLQGDHFQFDPDRVAEDPQASRSAMRDLVERSIAAGFYNIDVDASTLVDLDRETVDDQQEPNAERTVGTLAHVRSIEPLPVSAGGEVGEVGAETTTEPELRAFLDQVDRACAEREIDGLSKVSVQTGTQHGGVVLPDGSLAEVEVDFDTLERLSRLAREEYGLAGCVQHGASTLPDELFDRFPEVGAAEIHLATDFLNTILDHEAFPAELTAKIHDHLDEHHSHRREPDATDEQFIYRNRKRAMGALKDELWRVDEDVKRAIFPDLERRFAFLYEALGVAGTAGELDPVLEPQPVEVQLDEGWRQRLARG